MLQPSSPLKIATVCYANSLPFVHALRNIKDKSVQMTLATPSECGRLLQQKEVDVALIPSAVFDIEKMTTVTDFCIGSNGKVKSVVLFLDDQIQNVETIYLDTHSQTSATLVKVLAKERWNITPRYLPLDISDKPQKLQPHQAVLMIGDKVFDHINHYRYAIDLSEEWKLQYDKPFVFAVWAMYDYIPEVNDFLNQIFTETLRQDITAIATKEQPNYPHIDLLTYLTQDIQYPFTSIQKAAFQLFKQKQAAIS